ncbi:MAG: CIS tube protein [Halobacteriota archaeon]
MNVYGELATSSKLNKAVIAVLDQNGDIDEEIAVLFNPAEYSLEKSNKFQETEVPGLSSPVLQFVAGTTRSLTMELFFDSFAWGEDVRHYTDRLDRLLEIDQDLHAPPICRFMWGELDFKAVLERAVKKFTMFLPDGVPVRARVNVTFKEYAPLSEQLNNPPRHSADKTKSTIIGQDDSLWAIAAREYGDPSEWRHIARANAITNPRVLVPGTELIIPPLE